MKFIPESKNLELDIKLLGTDMDIISEKRNDIDINFDNFTKAAIRERFKVDYDGEELEIKEQKKISIAKSVSGKIVLKIPENLKNYGKIKAVGGLCKIKKLEFDGKIKYSGGNLKVEDYIKGDLKFKIQGGNLSINNIEGKCTAKIAGGKMVVENGLVNDIKLKVYGGTVYFTSNFDLKSDGEFKVYGGTVKLKAIDYKGNKKIYSKQVGGNIELTGKFPEDLLIEKKVNEGQSGFNFSFDLPSKISEFVSNIVDSKSKDGKKVKVSEKKENSKKEIEKILKMVDEGKISADQAAKLIEAIKE